MQRNAKIFYYELSEKPFAKLVVCLEGCSVYLVHV